MKPNLLKLQKQWYNKLKATGFKDIEATHSPQEQLYQWDSYYFIHYNKRYDLASMQEYYYMAEHFLTNHVFECKLDREIWALHSKAMSVRAISAELKKRRFARKGRGRHTIAQTIKRLTGVMLGSTSETG